MAKKLRCLAYPLFAVIVVAFNCISYVRAYVRMKRFAFKRGELTMSRSASLYSYKIVDSKVTHVDCARVYIGDLVIVLASKIAALTWTEYDIQFMTVTGREYAVYVDVLTQSGQLLTIRSSAFEDMPIERVRKGGKVAKTC